MNASAPLTTYREALPAADTADQRGSGCCEGCATANGIADTSPGRPLQVIAITSRSAPH
ncbi:hypothetical protein [Streptomyces sp. NPDC059479]|uniref:hypothetical protein n=1 Tax=Streptomyces sp. NPDC059479 TaxID=3346848 RepID=UPI0036B1FC97